MSEQTELVTAFELMDKADEIQILDEIKGLTPEKLVYSFGQGANKVEGLTKVGVQWAKRKLAEQNEIVRVDPDKMKIQLTDDACVVIVQAIRYKVDKTGREIALDSALGAKRQPRKQALKKGGFKDDPFYVEKAVAKAERNAIRSFIPEQIVVDLINYAKGKGKVEDISTENTPLMTTKAMDSINELINSLTNIYGEVQAKAVIDGVKGKLGIEDIDKVSQKTARLVYRELKNRVEEARE